MYPQDQSIKQSGDEKLIRNFHEKKLKGGGPQMREVRKE
jgi:hypothetical protein